MSADRADWAMQKPSLVEWMAWRRYLIATRASSSAGYAVLEEDAWNRLLEDLAQVESQSSLDPSFVPGRKAFRATADPRR
jgi:hypothetical protein